MEMDGQEGTENRKNQFAKEENKYDLISIGILDKLYIFFLDLSELLEIIIFS